MNKMNRKLEYSLMAIKHMSQKPVGALTTAKEVSDTYHAPFDATARVMQQMAQKGYLKSEQGAFGGYQLSSDLSQLTLFDLLQLVQGDTQIAKCMVKDEPCDIKGHCNIVSPIQGLNKRIDEFYKSLTLKELLAAK